MSEIIQDFQVSGSLDAEELAQFEDWLDSAPAAVHIREASVDGVDLGDFQLRPRAAERERRMAEEMTDD